MVVYVAILGAHGHMFKFLSTIPSTIPTHIPIDRTGWLRGHNGAAMRFYAGSANIIVRPERRNRGFHAGFSIQRMVPVHHCALLNSTAPAKFGILMWKM